MFMSSRDELPLSDASTTTRRVLTPPSESRIGGSDDAGSSGRKRKRDGNAMEVEDLLKEPFVVKVSEHLPIPSHRDINGGTALPVHSLCQAPIAPATSTIA